MYQATDQSWGPLDLDNLVDFAGDELQVLEPGSTSTSTDGEKGEQQTTKLVCAALSLSAPTSSSLVALCPRRGLYISVSNT